MIKNDLSCRLMMRRRRFLKLSLDVTAVIAASAIPAWSAANSRSAAKWISATGPLRTHASNPRYFADGSGRPVYLCGSHPWNNLLDMGRSDQPEPFDFAAYLEFLGRYGHNFIRLWTWDSVTWDTDTVRKAFRKSYVQTVTPHPWARIGADRALDGKAKFDLMQFDPVYFERLRARVQEAGRRGIYVSIMLFEGWGLMHANQGRAAPDGWAWRGHPFHPENNVNGIDAGIPGDANGSRVHSLANSDVNDIQKAYIHKVIDTVNDLDNVLYEVINEGGETKWDWWVVETLKAYQSGKPKQHPIGITGHGAEDLASMLASPADWVSPGRRDGFADNPPAWDGGKVSLLDTDHIWGTGGSSAWVWKSFLRGHNPLFMDQYDGAVLNGPPYARWESVRRSMGVTRAFANSIELAACVPHGELASTEYCLANPGSEYVIYVPDGGKVTVDLFAARGSVSVEWTHPIWGDTVKAESVRGGVRQEFVAPFFGDAGVLYLNSSQQD